MRAATTLLVAATLLAVAVRADGRGSAPAPGSRYSQTADYDDNFNTDVPNEKDRNFRECFCWDNATHDMCGGSKWNESPSCSAWEDAALWPVSLIFFTAFALCFYPLFLAIGRAMCNCCGGRQPSYDCCCPTDDSVMRFPGYSTPSVVGHKGAFLVCFFGYTALAVLGIVAAAHWNDTALQVIDTIHATATATAATVKTSEGAMRNLSSAPPLVNASVADHLLAVHRGILRRKDDIGAVKAKVNEMRSMPCNASYFALGAPMLLLFIGTVLMLLSVIGFPITVLAGLFSLASAVLCIVFAIWFILYIMSHALCRNFDATAVPIVVGSLESVGGCNDPALLAAINATAFAFDAHVRGTASPVCVDIASLCAAGFSCIHSTCGTPASLPLHSARVPFPDVTSFRTFIARSRRALPDGSSGTLAQCAAGCGNATMQATAARVVAFDASHAGAVHALASSVYPDMADCRYIRSVLGNSISVQMCSDGFAARSGRLNVYLGSASAVAVIALILFVRGVKRFSSKTPNAFVALCPCSCHRDHGVAGTPVCTCSCSGHFASLPQQTAYAQDDHELQPAPAYDGVMHASPRHGDDEDRDAYSKQRAVAATSDEGYDQRDGGKVVCDAGQLNDW
jgi:hypothetical protein